MAEDKNISQINMRIPGMKGGPRNRGAAVEKPVNGKETFMRLMQYFAKEIPVIIAPVSYTHLTLPTILRV